MERKFKVVHGTSAQVEEDLNKLAGEQPDLAVESHSVSLHPMGQSIISVVIVSWQEPTVVPSRTEASAPDAH